MPCGKKRKTTQNSHAQTQKKATKKPSQKEKLGPLRTKQKHTRNMSSELIIRATQEGSQIALLEDKQLVEFHKERYSDKFNVGDIYLGKVRKVVAGLNAAFVDIGHPKDAFLHYLDLGAQFRSLRAYADEVRKKKYRPLSEFPP